MTTLTSTEFNQGALWAANILMSTTRDTASAAEILCRIPNLHTLAAQASEKDIAPLREFVLNELPLGADHGYVAIEFGAVGVGDTIIEIPESGDVDDIEAVPGDVLQWVVYGTDAGGEKTTLVSFIEYPEAAKKLAEQLRAQL